MRLESEVMSKVQKDNLIRMLDGCICRVCVSDDPLEIVRMQAFGASYLGLLAQDRMLQLRGEKHEA